MENQVRERIVDQSKELFFNRGVRNVTMDELASACGISKKTLYVNFPSKEELLHYIMMQLRDELVERVRCILSDTSQPVFSRLRDVINAVSLHSMQFAPIFLEDVKRFQPGTWRELQAYKKNGIADAIRTLIHDGQTQGYIRKLPENFIIHVCFALIDDILTPETMLELSMPFHDLFEHLMSLFFEGFLTEDGKKAIYYIESS
ncbi:MAG: TetR/AcrR family transcriptional regulator [Spirochaetota bacterium]